MLFFFVLAAPSVAAETEAPRLPIDEVVVTATRDSQDPLKLAGNVTLIDRKSMQALAHTRIADLLVQAPGTWVTAGSGQEHLSAIRSPVFTGPGSCGAFLFLEDGVAIRPAGFCNVNQLMEINSEQMQAVEVIRGPGSALYGANALHGLLNFLTPAGSPSGLLTSFEAGPDNYYRVKFDSGGRSSDWRLLVNGTHDGGARADSGYDQGKLNLFYQRDLANSHFRASFAATYLSQQTAGFVFGQDAYKDKTLSAGNDAAGAYRDNRALRLLTHWSWDNDAEQNQDLRLYARHSSTQFRQHFLPGEPDEDNGQNSIGLLFSRHLARPSGFLIYGLDLEYTHGFLEEIQANTIVNGSAFLIETRPAGKHYDYTVNAYMAAPYIQVQRETGRWELNAGLRAEYLRYDYDNRMADGNDRDDGTPCGFGGCLHTRPADREDGFFELAPKFGALYHLDRQRTLYASLSRGFRPPQSTELYRLQSQQQIANLDSVILDSVELGLKSIGDTLAYDVAIYAMKKRNVILRDANGFNIDNGKTRHAGLETSANWQINDAWSLQAAASYALHRYDFSQQVAGGNTISSGDEVDSAPRRLGSVRLRWAEGSFTGELEWVHVGRYYIDPEQANNYAGHNLLNLRLDKRFSPNWSAALRLNNLADVRYAERADFAFGRFRYTPGRGRSLFVEIRYAQP
ncbi:MAG: TonB-dependent receptor [Gammaproteobacteria bacterium]|nr:TonB-dependent receptor [Gammaproteobacteria bacterium]